MTAAHAADAADSLAPKAQAFDLPPGVIYLDGNSLGPPPRAALARLRQCAEDEWRLGLIRSWNGWNDGAAWIDLPARAGAKIARLIGVAADEAIVADSVSVNIFKLAAALLARRPQALLVVEDDEFPTDGYVMAGLARLVGAPIERAPPGAAAGVAGAVAVVSAAHYKTGRLADIAAAEGAARRSGAEIIWDLSHATGLAPLALARDGARYAVGCGYKYLNGGPGAPAFLYVARDAARSLVQPIAGWMGAAAPFAFGADYQPADGVARFAAGTPPILSLAALDAALDLFDDVDLEAALEKSRALGDRFAAIAAEAGLAPLSAGGPRGGHLCFAHKEGRRIVTALAARGVIGDFRAPDLMRFGFSPLFLSHAAVESAARALVEIVSTRSFERPEFAPAGRVT